MNDDDDVLTVEAGLILTRVGASRRAVDLDLYLTVHEDLADTLRSEGLTGDELDRRIVEAMPQALARALHGSTLH